MWIVAIIRFRNICSHRAGSIQPYVPVKSWYLKLCFARVWATMNFDGDILENFRCGSLKKPGKNQRGK